MATKKITIQQKTANGYDILHPATVIEQVSGLSDALAAKLVKAFNELTAKSSPVGADLLAINDSADSNAPKKITLQQLLDFVQDSHNKGWYATENALKTAHATGTDGDWAIVGATDSIWVWDSDTNKWVDSDQKGQVTSVNGQTGAVTINIPTVNDAQLTIKRNGTSVGTFTANQSTAAEVNIAVVEIEVSSSQPASQKTGDFWYQVNS